MLQIVVGTLWNIACRGIGILLEELYLPNQLFSYNGVVEASMQNRICVLGSSDYLRFLILMRLLKDLETSWFSNCHHSFEFVSSYGLETFALLLTNFQVKSYRHLLIFLNQDFEFVLDSIFLCLIIIFHGSPEQIALVLLAYSTALCP